MTSVWIRAVEPGSVKLGIVTSFGALWGRSVPDLRDSAPEQVVGEIASVAVKIADREGLSGLSVKRIASKLGVAPAKLAGFLVTKDDVLDLAFDAFYGEIGAELAANDSTGEWRASLQAIAAATKGALERHPWALELMGTRPPYGPNGLDGSERALAAVDGIGLDSFAMTSAVNTVLAYVCGSIRRQQRGAPSDDAAETAKYLLDAVGSGAYPRLARIFGDSQDLTEAASYEAGLEQVLDGIGIRVAAARS
jgi:AcrR family transcriptional regulator